MRRLSLRFGSRSFTTARIYMATNWLRLQSIQPDTTELRNLRSRTSCYHHRTSRISKVPHEHIKPFRNLDGSCESPILQEIADAQPPPSSLVFRTARISLYASPHPW